MKKNPGKKAKHPAGHECKGVLGKRHWILFLDEHSDMFWTCFPKQKSDLLAIVKELGQEQGTRVGTIRLDKSGENRVLEAACKQEGLGIKFEFTSPNTPKQNRRIERKFATLYGRVRAMINAILVQDTNTLWTEAAETATDLDNPVTRPGESQDSFQKFYGDKKRCFAASNNLKTFGEEIIVADSAKIRAKLRDRGKKCLWLKYAKKMSLATYRLYVQSQDKKYHIQ